MSSGFFGQPSNPQRNPEQLVFHAQDLLEYNPIHPNMQSSLAQHFGLRPVYRDYLCGVCGSKTTGRVLCDVKRESDGTITHWCVCACDKHEPTVIQEHNGVEVMQLPQPKKFHAATEWPPELQSLYEEASRSFSAGAYTSASMVCRKILMSCVCYEQGEAGVPVEEGKSFAHYVDYLASKLLNFPAAKAPIDAIRSIGNDANHHVKMVTQQEAERSMTIVHRMLDTIYALPKA